MILILMIELTKFDEGKLLSLKIIHVRNLAVIRIIALFI